MSCQAPAMSSHAPPLSPLDYLNGTILKILPSLTGSSCSLVATSVSPYKTSRVSIDLKADEPSLLCDNKTFFHCWMDVFVGIDAFLVVWLALHGQGTEKEQLMVSRVSPTIIQSLSQSCPANSHNIIQPGVKTAWWSMDPVQNHSLPCETQHMTNLDSNTKNLFDKNFP